MSNNNLYNALGTFIEAMRQFTIALIMRNYPNEPWEGVFFSRLTAEQQATWNRSSLKRTETKNLIDYHNLSFVASCFRDELAKEVGGRGNTYTFGSCVNELKEARNKCQHYDTIEPDDQDRAFSNMIKVADMLNMTELKSEIKKLKGIKMVTPVAVATVPTAASAVESIKESDVIDDGSPLKPWFEVCAPHYDIRDGNLDESRFAANLNDVAFGIASEEYANSAIFFNKTYVTAGMRDIISRVVRALNGEQTENRVIALQTSFGGGKTHTLISIYYIAKGGKRLLDQDFMKGLLPEGLTAKFDSAKVAVFTNNSVDPVQGRRTDEGLTIRTLWGQIAYELGGVEGYNKMRANDEGLVAPSSAIMKPIIEQAQASLILIDELADYCAKASGVHVGASNLYIQTNSFVQTLTETVAQVPGCVLIATLPASASEVADTKIGTEILQSLESRLTRIATSIKPVDDMDVYEVVRHRLFEPFNDSVVAASKRVAKRYKDMYHHRHNDLPAYCDRADYATRIVRAYPFHPELIEILRQRWGSYHNFQRTRGVLRLLASIVQDLWRRRYSLTGPNILIHTSDAYLENLNALRGTITKLVGNQWESVMAADVYGTGSNAKRIDDEEPASTIGRYRLTQGIATTLLMASIGAETNIGLTMKELKLCMLRPKAFNHSDVDTALNKLEQTAHYLHSSRGVGEPSYWFESRANINILLIQAESDIKDNETNADILRRLSQAKGRVNSMNVLVNPTADVPEQRRLTLIIMHPAINKGNEKELEKAVKSIALTRGNSNRTVKNTILYLACSEQGLASLTDKIKGLLACDKVLLDFGSRLDEAQIKEIKRKRADDDKAANELLPTAYNIVVRYTTKGGMETATIINPANDIATQINVKLMDTAGINGKGWVLTAIGSNLLRKNNLLPAIDKPIRVKDIYEAFLCYDDKPMITGAEAVKATINRYCQEGLFNVAVKGSDGNYTRIYHHEPVPYLDIDNDDYMIVDPTVSISKADDNDSSGTSSAGSNTQNGPASAVNGSLSTPAANTVKKYRRVVVSGSIPIENYPQIYSSFINILRSNKLKIEVRLTANSTESSPLTASSQLIQKVKESASQLGLDFETEEG